MAKPSSLQKNTANINTKNIINNGVITKVKRTRRTVPRNSPPRRTSVYRGVTRHRWTGRFEAHLWDKNCWNEGQKKKGRQVYLGAYEDEETAGHSYDLAALKYWGQETILNFPLSTYHNELKQMEGQSREEYIGSLRRKSSGFSRGASKYRGVARHHHNGRWEARIGRVLGNKYLYLGTYATEEEAATAYDMAAIEYRGLNAITNFDLSRYIDCLNPNPTVNHNITTNSDPIDLSSDASHHQQPPESSLLPVRPAGNATSALGLLLQSSKFKEMVEMATVSDCPSTQRAESGEVLCSFPDDIQRYFECQDSSYGEDDEMIFGDLNTFVPSMFQLCDFEC